MPAQIFGRDAELRTIGAFIGSLPRSPGALVLARPPGAGKTTLVRAAAAVAREHAFTVLETAPAHGDLRLAFACLSDLLTPCLDAVLGELPPPQARALRLALLPLETPAHPPEQRVIAAPAASGTEHFQLMINSATSNTGPIIATGKFTADGVDHEGTTTATFTFPNGSFKVHHSPGRGRPTFNPRTCLLTINFHGTYTVGHGTGKYAGISGHGRYQLNILAVGARNSRGKCSISAPPVAFEQLVKASGPVTLK